MNSVICLAVDTPDAMEAVVPYSEQRPCVDCATPVWVSPSGLAVPNAQYLCINCAVRTAEPGEKIYRAPGLKTDMLNALVEPDTADKMLNIFDKLGITEAPPEIL